jgi:hypothetical protein
MNERDRAASAVVTVGEGRGFVVSYRYHRFVITAAHCLPFLPPCHGASYIEERTYQLLSSLGSEPSVWAECLFADPISDVAVLGSPDNQELSDEADDYEAFVESATPLTIAEAPEQGHGWMLSLQGKWFGCSIRYMKHRDGPLFVSNADQAVDLGMSGSPIISDESAAIGVVCLGSDQLGCKNPRLVRDLPAWIVRDVSMTG